MKYPRKWEVINDQAYRIKVPGGWLVMTRLCSGTLHTVFISDAAHTWELEG